MRKQSGDTLVEVAIALAILAAVIVTAFSVSNHALRLSTEAEQRVEAAQLQQYQAEAIRSLHDNYSWDDFKVIKIGTRAIAGSPDPAKTDPCGNDAATSVPDVNRFSIKDSSGKWQPVQGVFHDSASIFTQCVVAYLVDQDHMRFDIAITWGSQNKSLLTTYQDKATGVIAP